jgi:hypothetical protein
LKKKTLGNSHIVKGDCSSSSDEDETEKPLLLDLKEEAPDVGPSELESPENGSEEPEPDLKINNFFQVR